jgi:hypothetical protein
MSDGSSSTSLIEPREDRGSSSTALPPSLMTREDDSGGNQYGNPLNPILNRQIRISDQLGPMGNSIALSMTDRMLPEWIMRVLGHANLIYICLQGHIWFTYGQNSALYCIRNDIVKGTQVVYQQTKLEHLLVHALDVEREYRYTLNNISGIVMDQYSNLYILFNSETASIERYQVGGFLGVRPAIRQLYGARNEEGKRFRNVGLGKVTIPIRTQNCLEALSLGRDNNYLFVVGYGDHDIGIISYDPLGEGDMYMVHHFTMNEHVPNRHDTIHIFTDHRRSMIYMYFTNRGVLVQLDSQFDTARWTDVFVPNEPVIFVKWNDFGNLHVFANQNGLPIVYEINSANGEHERTIRDPLIQSLRSNRTLQPIFRFSEGPYGLYVYCRDRIVDITLF